MCLEEKENLCVSVSGTIIPTRELALLPHSPVSLKPRALCWVSPWLLTCSFLVACANRGRMAVFVMNSEFIFILPQLPYDQLLFFSHQDIDFLVHFAPASCWPPHLPWAMHAFSLWSAHSVPCCRVFWEPHQFSWGHLLDLSDWFLMFLVCLCLQLSSRSWRLDVDCRFDAVRPLQRDA